MFYVLGNTFAIKWSDWLRFNDQIDENRPPFFIFFHLIHIFLSGLAAIQVE